MSQPKPVLLKELKETLEQKESQENAEFNDSDYLSTDITTPTELQKQRFTETLCEIIHFMAQLNYDLYSPETQNAVLNDINHRFGLYKHSLLHIIIEDYLKNPSSAKSDWINLLINNGAEFSFTYEQTHQKVDFSTGKEGPKQVFIVTRSILDPLFNYYSAPTGTEMPSVADYRLLANLSVHMRSIKAKRREIISNPHKKISTLPKPIAELIEQYSPVVFFEGRHLVQSDHDDFDPSRYVDPSYFDLQNLFNFFERHSEPTNPQKLLVDNHSLKQETKKAVESLTLKDVPLVLKEYTRLIKIGIISKTTSPSHVEMDVNLSIFSRYIKNTPINGLGIVGKATNETVLHYFVKRGHTSMVKILLESGANRYESYETEVYLGDGKPTFVASSTVLLEALFNQRLDTLEMLLAFGKEDINLGTASELITFRSIENPRFMTMPPLLWAVMLQDENEHNRFPAYYFVKLLLEAGADLCATTKKLDTEPLVKDFGGAFDRIGKQKELKELFEKTTIPKLTALDISLNARNMENIIQNNAITNLIYQHIYFRIREKTGRRPAPADYKPYSAVERSTAFWQQAIRLAEELILPRELHTQKTRIKKLEAELATQQTPAQTEAVSKEVVVFQAKATNNLTSSGDPRKENEVRESKANLNS